MEGFDTMAMPYLASPLSLSNLQGDYLNSMPGMDLPDQRSNFDTETFVRYVSPSLLGISRKLG
jgi:acid phosphatase